ncbi:MAG: hypothetical protein KF699_09970 [Phycisphaeraceae bacterium]|nr:hypothetical protein [Phycisphaeraceae bacterium]MBX3407793.1 hypothetical protein [Phycisphaeraceae bacterium]
MFGKLVFLIVGVGVVAGVLLVNRQLRIQAAHELADAQRRVAQHDRTLWRLRAEIASRVTPQRVEAAASRLGRLVAITPERFQEFVRREAEDAARNALAVDHRP